MDHNNDTLHGDLRSYALNTSFDILVSILVSNRSRRSPSQDRRANKLAGKVTVATKLQREMNRLTTILSSAQVHFVRCVKTSSENMNRFDAPLVHYRAVGGRVGCRNTL